MSWSHVELSMELFESTSVGNRLPSFTVRKSGTKVDASEGSTYLYNGDLV